MDRQAAYRLEQLVPLFNATDSPDQLSNLVAEAGQILYGTLHDGTLVIDGDDIKTVAVSICDSKREYQRTLWDDGKLDFSYRLLFKLVSDSVSERQRTIYHLKWSDGAGSNTQLTDWENDYKHQGQRYALCCTQLASMLTVEPAAPDAVAVPEQVVPADPVKPAGRRGRLPKAESELRETSMLAQLREHPTMASDPARLGRLSNVSESTARRLIDSEREKFNEMNRHE